MNRVFGTHTHRGHRPADRRQALTTANGLGYLVGALASAAVAQQVTAAVTPSQAVGQSAEVRSHELAP